MRRIANTKISKPIEWIPMRYEADCWVAACAMAAGVSYEEVEEFFGSGAKYSDKVLAQSDNREMRVLDNFIRQLAQVEFFVSHGCYPMFLPELNPMLKARRRYLLSTKSPGHDPQRPWMSHSIVLGESGTVFDPDPKYHHENPKSIATYPELIAWEIVKLE